MTNHGETPCISLKAVSSAHIHLRCSPLFCLFSFFLFSLEGRAQTSVEYSIHANIIYHFTKYIDWPDSKKNGDFVIGVVGDTPLFDELKRTTANKTVGDRKIVVKKLYTSHQTFDCHILFLSEEKTSGIKKIIERTAQSNILLVCEYEGAASRGACINFKIESQRLKLEINTNSIQQRRLHIASELLRLGTIVE